MAMRNRAVDIQDAQKKALEFATQWLRTHPVIPEGVDIDDDAFGKLMNTVTRGLVSAYAQGYMEGK